MTSIRSTGFTLLSQSVYLTVNPQIKHHLWITKKMQLSWRSVLTQIKSCHDVLLVTCEEAQKSPYTSTSQLLSLWDSTSWSAGMIAGKRIEMKNGWTLLKSGVAVATALCLWLLIWVLGEDPGHAGVPEKACESWMDGWMDSSDLRTLMELLQLSQVKLKRPPKASSP